MKVCERDRRTGIQVKVKLGGIVAERRGQRIDIVCVQFVVVIEVTRRKDFGQDGLCRGVAAEVGRSVSKLVHTHKAVAG